MRISTKADRILWAWLCGVWSDWRSALVIVEPETVIPWHQRQISGARHVAEPSRRNLAADLPRPFEPPSLSGGSVSAADGFAIPTVTQIGARTFPFEHGNLLSQGEALHGGVAPTAEEDWECGQNRKDEFDHERMAVTCRNAASAGQRLRVASR